jgi:hypothetical protein
VIKFTSTEAYDYAYQHWNSHSELIIVTAAASSTPHRDYFEVKSPNWSRKDLSVTYSAKLIDPSDCTSDLTVNYGAPDGNGGVNTQPKHGDCPPPSKTSHVCSTPTAHIIEGLPAAPCGQSFDEVLDKKIGLYDFTGKHATQDLLNWAPGVTGAVPSDIFPPLTKRGLSALEKRSFGSFFRKIAKAVVSAVKTVVAAVKTAVTASAVSRYGFFIYLLTVPACCRTFDFFSFSRLY